MIGLYTSSVLKTDSFSCLIVFFVIVQGTTGSWNVINRIGAEMTTSGLSTSSLTCKLYLSLKKAECDYLYLSVTGICMPVPSTPMADPLLVRRRSVGAGHSHKATFGRQWRVSIWNPTRLPYSTALSSR